MDAAEVLPVWAMSRAITTDSGSFSCLASWSMMRMLAWCGMNTSMSAGVRPAASIALAPTLAISKLAHLNTVGPFCRKVGQEEIGRAAGREGGEGAGAVGAGERDA